MRKRFLDSLALLANTYNPPSSYNSQNIQYHSKPPEVYQQYQYYQSTTPLTQQLIQSPPKQSYAPPVFPQQPPMLPTQPNSGFVIPTFLPIDDPIESLNKAMIFLSSTYSLRFPPKNNQLRTCPIYEHKLQFKMAKFRFRMFKEDSLKVMRAMLERVKLQEQGLSIQLERKEQINQG
ncbi:hypothetical protein Tco_0747923 [Tanacetum coccineum]|uniref:Uncharacterized protein n=1 Tax=Tanacetum coccineum TaxID=301880 RepID=A0ABQ4YWV5_9ASTR